MDPWLWAGLVVGLAFVGGMALAGRGLIWASQQDEVRCYALDRPLTQVERRILDGGPFECATRLCRAVVKYYPDRGLACYFPRPLSSSGSIAHPAAGYLR